MSEREYAIETLCLLPKEMLERRLALDDNLPGWLMRTEDDVIEEALLVYEQKIYKELRKKQDEILF